MQKKARLFGSKTGGRGRASGEPLNGNAEQPKLKPKPDLFGFFCFMCYGSTLHSFVSILNLTYEERTEDILQRAQGNPKGEKASLS